MVGFPLLNLCLLKIGSLRCDIVYSVSKQNTALVFLRSCDMFSEISICSFLREVLLMNKKKGSNSNCSLLHNQVQSKKYTMSDNNVRVDEESLSSISLQCPFISLPSEKVKPSLCRNSSLCRCSLV